MLESDGKNWLLRVASSRSPQGTFIYTNSLSFPTWRVGLCQDISYIFTSQDEAVNILSKIWHHCRQIGRRSERLYTWCLCDWCELLHFRWLLEDKSWFKSALPSVSILIWDICDFQIAFYMLSRVLKWPYWDSWILQDLHDGSPLIKPVRRRAGILVGTWATKLKPQDKAPVYRALLSLMADEDAAIALTGFKALCDIVEDWGFSEDEFLEFVEPCFRLAAQQLNTVTDYESQLQVIGLDSFHFWPSTHEKSCSWCDPTTPRLMSPDQTSYQI